MPATLILNPFATLFPDPKRSGGWIVQAPVPGLGLQRLSIDESRCPTLFEMCGHSGESSLALIDIHGDLDQGELSTLTEYGLIIEPEHVPAKPYFSCHLDSVEISYISADSDLIVDPTMRFEPFDLIKFRTWGTEKNLSPHLPSVWIEDDQTGLRSGYWLDREQAAHVSLLTAGEPPCELPPDLLSKLRAAEIIVSKQKLGEKSKKSAKKIAESISAFAQNGYSVLRGVIPKNQITHLQDFYQEFERQGFMTLGDDLVPRRYVAPVEPLASTIHRNLTKLMTALAGQSVIPSYCYAASYLEGADLKPHRDRPQCEFSFSMQIDYEPQADDGISPWPLYLSDQAGKEVPVYLGNGDCLAYKGCELTHYALPEGHHSTSLFFHYIPEDFSGDLV
ncbi:MAG: hypothetical protein ABJB40_02165 [Acidobacteriota bacterium]